MKNALFVCLLTLTYNTCFAQTITVKNDQPIMATNDSTNVFYKALFKALKVGYLHRKMVNWKTVEAETYTNLKRYNTFKASLKEITNLFDQINATHCLVYRGNDKYTGTKKAISKELYSAQWKKKYSIR